MKEIYIRKTSQGLHATSPSGTVYQSWYYDSLKDVQKTVESIWFVLKSYQEDGYKLVFEEDKEVEELDRRFE